MGAQDRFRAIVVERRRAELPPVIADPHRLQQVVVNLLLNAADAVAGAPEKRIVVETARRSSADPEWVQLRVSDTGHGIDPAHLPALFDPFFTTKEPGKGTGLGLAIAKPVVEAMGGTIRAESAPGRGATFTVELPASNRTDPKRYP